MATLKRRLGNLFTHLTGLNLSRKGEGWKLMELETLSRFLSDFQVDCVFDVGANTGQYGVRLRQIGYHGLIFSFEPNPSAFAKLQVETKGDSGWIVKQLALDSEPRTLMFNVMKGHQFSSLHEPDHSQTDTFLGLNVVEAQVPVLTATLDELFPALQKEYRFSRPFLKMDTQGHDLQVVGGASRCLSRFVGLQSELNVTRIYKGGCDFSEVLALYRGRRFKLTALVPNNCGHFPDLNEIDCIMYNSEFK
jgi:FkbM family methyltransferase